MATEIQFDKSNSLVICDTDQCLDALLAVDQRLQAVMLSARDGGASDYDHMEPLIVKLLDAGCKYFVCAGKYSEVLHDFIDDVIIDRELGGVSDNTVDVITTWHDTDTDEEVAEFFLYSTLLTNALFVAFLEQNEAGDKALARMLLRLVVI